jgi:lipoprotein NlpD
MTFSMFKRAMGVPETVPTVRRIAAGALAAALLALVSACASNKSPAPVETRSPAPGTQLAVPAPAAGDTAPALPGAENAGKPGYYTVKRGDNLIRIALENGQNWRDLVKWNKLENPNVLEVGQVLRVVAPGVDPTVAASRPVAAPGKVESRPIEKGAPAASTPAAGASAGATATGAAPVASVPAASAPPPQQQPPAPREGDEDVDWLWPAAGPIIVAFDEKRSKGVALAGKAGDPVLAAADGRVVYAGSGIRGYGNLLIVKHNNTYLTAYAHNQTLLVKEDQVVRRGQKIAEMGATDAERVQLHFEIRREGKPVDPTKLLPPR